MALQDHSRSEFRQAENLGSGLPSRAGDENFDGRNAEYRQILDTQIQGNENFYEAVANTSRRVNLTGVSERTATNCYVKLDELNNLLPLFSGSSNENIHVFLSAIEQTKRTFNVEDQVMKLLVLNHLRGTAQIWLSSQPDLFFMEYTEVAC